VRSFKICALLRILLLYDNYFCHLGIPQEPRAKVLFYCNNLAFGLQTKYSTRFAHYLGTDYIIGIKIPFLNWRLKSFNGRLVQSNECWLGCYLHKPKVHTWNTKLLVAVGFSWLTLQGIVHNFQEHFLCIYSTLVFKKLFFTVFITADCFFTCKITCI